MGICGVLAAIVYSNLMARNGKSTKFHRSKKIICWVPSLFLTRKEECGRAGRMELAFLMVKIGYFIRNEIGDYRTLSSHPLHSTPQENRGSGFRLMVFLRRILAEASAFSMANAG